MPDQPHWEIPRHEHPRPQFVRPDGLWQTLNGQWAFEIDKSDSGFDRGLVHQKLEGSITVPFPPESELSGVGERDFMAGVWYRREITVSEDWSDKRVLVHFQAVDYDTTVWAALDDGAPIEIGRHRGGFTPFTFDLSAGLGGPGGRIAELAGHRATVIVRARDDRYQPQPRGKQTQRQEPYGCLYPRVTGIWQSVWLEAVPSAVRLAERPRITPDLANDRIHVSAPLSAGGPGPHQPRIHLRVGLTERIDDRDDNGNGVPTPAGRVLTHKTIEVGDFTPSVDLDVVGNGERYWSPENPHLFGIEIELLDPNEAVIDRINAYAGFRSTTLEAKAFKLNDQTVFQRLVLDQGWWPKGLMTAPSDQAMVGDIALTKKAGFNGARLHQKVFEERQLYHADRLGLMCWGEFGDWGSSPPDHGRVVHGLADHQRHRTDATFITQWLEALERDYSHPCLIGWCPLNETSQPISGHITPLDDATHGMYLATKLADPTRPVLDSSGYSHRVPESDIYDSHDYQQDPQKFAEKYQGLAQGDPFINNGKAGQPWNIGYRGQPYFVSEFGGIKWVPQAADQANEAQSWGYGQAPQTQEQFLDRFERLCATLLDDPNMFAYCYTQLTDVFQEVNGIFHFNRTSKFDDAAIQRIAEAQQRPAAIEQVEMPE